MESNRTEEPTMSFSADQLELVRSLAPRIESLMSDGIDSGDALMQALAEATQTFERVQRDAELREAIGRAAWVAARTSSDLARAVA